ncbi:MAG: hypothetical protein IJY88_00860, partial [Clostridia bacterium]|nr:hypothetical protein [Clostridia bacterium]
MKFAHVRACEHFTFAKQIFHSDAISLARRANFVEKTTGQNLSFFLSRGAEKDAHDFIKNAFCHGKKIYYNT